jgi:hypothetical protein
MDYALVNLFIAEFEKQNNYTRDRDSLSHNLLDEAKRNNN